MSIDIYLKFKIDTKNSGWDASTVEETKAILRQIMSSADYDNTGRGRGIKVKINGTTHTIFKWLCDNNADYYLSIIGKKTIL